jgi:hypothetical protein
MQKSHSVNVQKDQLDLPDSRILEMLIYFVNHMINEINQITYAR